MQPKLTNYYRTAFLIFFVALSISKTQAQKPAAAKKPVFVIVHGAWGGSWSFREVDSLMSAKGCIVYRPSLTGLGERVHLAAANVGLNTHITDVVNTVLFEDLHDIILIGHSYGGMVITGVADQVPDRIRKLVYLDAMVPEDGENVMKLMDPRGEWLQKMTQGDYVVPSWVRADQPPPKDVPHPLKTFTDPIVLRNTKVQGLAATYILTVDHGQEAGDDDFAPSAARARARGWQMVEMRADHNPQWSAVDELVRIFLNLN